jgi:hypothetical protein
LAFAPSAIFTPLPDGLDIDAAATGCQPPICAELWPSVPSRWPRDHLRPAPATASAGT